MTRPTDSSTELSDAAYLLEVFAAMPEFKGDWNALATKHGVHISTTSRRFKAIAKRHGYKFENGKVTQEGGDGVAGGQPTETPKKAKAKRAPNHTPTPQKRKLSEATVKEEEDILEAQDDVKTAGADENKRFDDGVGSGKDADGDNGPVNEDYGDGAKRVKMDSGGEEIGENGEELE